MLRKSWRRCNQVGVPLLAESRAIGFHPGFPASAILQSPPARSSEYWPGPKSRRQNALMLGNAAEWTPALRAGETWAGQINRSRLILRSK